MDATVNSTCWHSTGKRTWGLLSLCAPFLFDSAFKEVSLLQPASALGTDGHALFSPGTF